MKRENLTFTERFAVPAFSSMRSDRMTDAMSAAVRSLYVAESLEAGKDAEDASSVAGRMFRKTIADTGRQAVKSLSDKGLLREVPAPCSVEMAKSGARSWKADNEALEDILSEVMEGKLSEEDMALLWLWREAGTLPFIFTPDEMKGIESSADLKGFRLWSLMYGKKLELGNVKRRVEAIPIAEDRAESFFIEAIFLPEGDRMEALMKMLSERGHDTEERTEGGTTLIRIDGIWYRALLNARKVGRLPIEGVSLVPACM